MRKVGYIVRAYIAGIFMCILGYFEREFLHKTIIKCKSCNQKIKVPTYYKKIIVTCPRCKTQFPYKYHLTIKRVIGILLLIIIGLPFATLIAYAGNQSSLMDSYMFFIIPYSAMFLGILASIGFMSILILLVDMNIHFPKISLAVLLMVISLSSFWLSEYISYHHQTLTVNYVTKDQYGNEVSRHANKEAIDKYYSFSQYIIKSSKKKETRVAGQWGKTPILSAPQEQDLGTYGIVLFILKQVGFTIPIPIIW